MPTSEEMVKEFHTALELPVGTTPAPIPDDRLLLRLRLILEEVGELVCAMTGQPKPVRKKVDAEMAMLADELFSTRRETDLVETADGCCDAHVVISGTAIEFGIPEDKVYKEIHKSNMAKVGGPIREDGKRLKPEGWEPPNVAKVLRKAGMR